MKHIHPDYYDKFHCIASACPITCCKEWKIAVDDETNRHWKMLAPPDSVDEHRNNLSAYTCIKDGARVIRLDDEHNCPFLSDERLCRLVTAYGDGVLSHTCTIFPRELHEYDTHTEESLMPCCPAVIDLWRDTPVVFPAGVSQSPLSLIRDKLTGLMQDTALMPESALLEGFYVLLELHRNEPVSCAQVQEYFSARSMQELHHAMADIHIQEADTVDECNELLQDLAVNYQKEGLYDGFLQDVIKETPNGSWQDFSGALSGYDILLRNYLANEFYSDLISRDAYNQNLEHMLIQYQWIIIEYTAIRQSLFHLWNDSGRQLLYENVRDYIVIISRMTGYDDDDIRSYLENSFEKLIWEWGYAALIVGR